ncbi:LytTR family DNA-binding domain-containing protein [uncultured Erythrobacter sp.]|uniref:LytTR family DNA-binding domain-containing protein n=1 Tax=uncultured Erythrobacter sp. TaxID=263913 RepID=UPI0026583595|nr:LytTR family DNA-binding domain-containing protein [uncultured Erythrobacter sp.]
MTRQPASQRHALARRIIIDLAVMTAIGVFLAVIGPFGSIAAPLPERFVTWIGFAWLGYACYRPMQSVAAWGERALDLPRWGVLTAAVLVGTVPMTVAVVAINTVPLGSLRWPGLEIAMGTYFSVLVIGGAVTLLFNVVQGGARAVMPVAGPAAAPTAPFVPESASGPVPAPPAPPSPNPLLDQLPAELGSAIIALEMEDHYLRVHTMLGSALVLMRLRDGIALLGDLQGMQVHRSWWVAREAVEEVVRDGRNIRLKLPRGLEAPVARANVTALRDARWI